MIRKNLMIVLLIASFSIFTSFKVAESERNAPALRVIVIDAGHGGKDAGAPAMRRLVDLPLDERRR